MSSHQDVDGSVLSHAGRRPIKCGICYMDFTQHFSRHSRKVHPDDQACVAQWVGGTKYVIVPNKEKKPAAGIINEDQPNIDE